MSGWVLAALLAGLAGALVVPLRVSVRDAVGGRGHGGMGGVGAGAGWADGLGIPGEFVSTRVRPGGPSLDVDGLPVAGFAGRSGSGAIGWSGPVARAGWMVRWRWLLSALAGAGAASFVGGRAGLVVAPVAIVAAWVTLGRVEPAAVRRDREQARRELPHVVRLLGTALTSGAAPADALEVVAEALPGAATRRLLPVAVRLRLGADPVATWAVLAGDSALAPLGRALARAQSGGVPVATAVARLADDLTRGARADVEDRARAVGVRAAPPLGLCLLPAFLLIGIVPLVGGLLSSLAL